MARYGFSLVELLLTLAVAAIVAGLAAPAWHRWLARAALDAATTQTLSGLALARRLALSTGHATTLCLTDDLRRCSFAGHEWMLFGNADGGDAAHRSADEALIRRHSLPRGVHVSGTRGYATYLPQLRAATTLTFDFCHAGAPRLQRSVVVSQSGRARVERRELPAGGACGR